MGGQEQGGQPEERGDLLHEAGKRGELLHETVAQEVLVHEQREHGGL